MANLRRAVLWLMLGLLLARGALAVDSISGGSEGLTGRRFLVLGDSYTAGYGLEDPTLDWTYVMADSYGMTQLNFAISGSTLASGPLSYEPMVRRCLTLPAEDRLDFILIQGASNDYFKGIPIGQADSWDPETVCGALNRIIDALRTKYPSATLIGFTPWISDDTKNKAGRTQQEYTDAMLEVFRLQGLLCYDASNTAENGMYMQDRAFRTDNALTPGDWYHLSAAGHALFAPRFAAWLEKDYLQVGLRDRFYDLGNASDVTRAAVAALTEQEILPDISGHLFAPTRQVTRGQLALTLHRLAGMPWGPAADLQDVAPDTDLHAAVSWAMDAGIFSPADRFCPDLPVTREMLSAVLYRYYTDWAGFPVEKTVGLGTFTDGSEAASYARIPLGWALEEYVLLPQDGLLHPKGNVSRGQLAVSLRRLMELT